MHNDNLLAGMSPLINSDLEENVPIHSEYVKNNLFDGKSLKLKTKVSIILQLMNMKKHINNHNQQVEKKNLSVHLVEKKMFKKYKELKVKKKLV